MCIRKINVSKETSSDEGRNLYEILKLDFKEIRKLDKEKQDQEIRTAYHREIRRWHSDTAGELGDDEMAHEVIAAYEILTNHERRAEYHNKADYTEGGFQKLGGDQFCGPNVRLRNKYGGPLGAACLGGSMQSLMRSINRKSIEKGCNIEDWAKSLGIGFVAGAITGATSAEITNGVTAIGRNAVIASGGGAVTWKQAFGHAVTGAAVGGVTATAVGAVSNVSSTNVVGPFAPRLRDGISLEKFTKYSLTNKGSESVLGTITGFVEERLDGEQENRPIGEHVMDRQNSSHKTFSKI
ncbi:unnamed protein product [Mytilus edulis]|uniref:J domain-containing protein n=1 Tax=Mytilus edulis TaxID=6550 RepID=A0A8S3QQL0_MYTED|nr:unnamed protein product [Mytilus edulis]